MRKKLLPLLLTVCLASFVTGLVACGDTSDNSEKNENLKDDEKAELEVPKPEHAWDDGVITTKPTCITPGVITYTCEDCDATKKEITDADGESHVYGNYECDETYHWRTCRLCGEVEKYEHDFSGSSKEDGVDTLLECECGIHTTVGEYYAYKVNFICDNGVSLFIYDSQDYSIEGVSSTVAYSRSKTGELLKDGEGQVNFEVVPAIGYKIKSVTAEPSKGYKNLKGEEETNRDNTYRITKITSDLTVYVETEIDMLDLPVMVINTVNSAPILDKENYVSCAVSVLNAEEKYCFSEISAGIRGRGNSTWDMPKKPYKLNFDSKVDLFGNGKAKKWTLIANYADPSLVRNFLAFTIGAEFDDIKDTTTAVQFVEVYLNGSYGGVYLICEQNEVGETRVNIEDDFVKATNPEDIGFLLELDNKAYYATNSLGEEGKDYILCNGNAYAIKSPDYGGLPKVQEIDFSVYSEYIKQYLEDTWSALLSENYELVKTFIDVNSFADAYILNELFNTCDVGWTSFWMYKRENGKLYCGPVWDFDVSTGNCDYNPSSALPTTLWAKGNNVWFEALLKFDNFTQLVGQRLYAYADTIKTVMADSLENLSENYKNSFLRNFERWDTLGKYVWPNTEEIVAITTWEGQINYVKEWLSNSLEYMVSVYCSESTEN